MYQPFKVGDTVVVWILIDKTYRLPVFATVQYAHPEYGWCTCDIEIYSTSYWNNEITPIQEWDSEKAPIHMRDFDYPKFIQEIRKKKNT